MARLAILVALVLSPLACRPVPTSTAVALLDQAGRRTCGAVAVGPNLLVTAAHCLNGSRTVRYVTPELWQHTASASRKARVVRLAPSRDLAWLETEGEPLPYRSTRPWAAGERVRVLVPLRDWTWSETGVVEGDTEAKAEADRLNLMPGDAPGASFLVTDLSIEPGWSGSPVIGDDGQVVGVVSACVGFVRWAGLRREKACKPGLALVAPLR